MYQTQIENDLLVAFFMIKSNQIVGTSIPLKFR